MKHKLIMENWRRYLLKEDGEDADSFMKYGEKGRAKDVLQKDRDFKREWNAKADHDFFNNVIKIHWVGAYGSELSAEIERAGGKPARNQPIFDSLRAWGDLTSINKDEISCVGYVDAAEIPDTAIGSDSRIKPPYGFLIDGYVSYASRHDARTEWTSLADEEDIQHHAGSGLPKRADKSRQVHAMYGEEDFGDIYESGYNELIVDNWRVSGIILDMNTRYWHVLKRKAKSQEVRADELSNIKEYCVNIGIDLFDINLTPI